LIGTSAQPQVRARRAEDWEALLGICQALPLAQNPLGLRYPTQEQAQQTFSTPDSQHVFGLVAEVDAVLVGEIALERRAGRAAHCGVIVRLLIHPNADARAVGGGLLEAVIELADRSLNLSRLERVLPTDDAEMMGLHRDHGFTVEGTMRDALYRAGQYMDTYIMARLRDAF
jgi:putative acetyltransferase